MTDALSVMTAATLQLPSSRRGIALMASIMSLETTLLSFIASVLYFALKNSGSGQWATKFVMLWFLILVQESVTIVIHSATYIYTFKMWASKNLLQKGRK